jgi:hypothetical protein
MLQPTKRQQVVCRYDSESLHDFMNYERPGCMINAT